MKRRSVYIVLVSLILLLFILLFTRYVSPNTAAAEHFENAHGPPFDVVFSYTMHEHLDGFIMTLQNLYKAAKSLNIGVVVNTNKAMYEPLKEALKQTPVSPNIWVHPHPTDKGWAEFTILEGHLNNIDHFYKDLKKDTRFYCLMTSNTMFHRKLTWDTINEAIRQRKPIDRKQSTLESHRPNTWYPRLAANTYILEKMKSCPIVMQFHEGTLYESEFLNSIPEKLREWNVKENIAQQMPFEEFMLPSLYADVYGYEPASICQFLYKPPTQDSLKSIEKCSVKPVPRPATDPLRQYIANLTFD